MSAKIPKWVPVVDEDLCTGCGGCVEACGVQALTIEDRVAVLSRPDACVSDARCIAPCPADAIHMAWVEMADRPRPANAGAPGQAADMLPRHGGPPTVQGTGPPTTPVS
jgi:NAD-dependent dihydropyrimidine dehydrogenase PreA subunit